MYWPICSTMLGQTVTSQRFCRLLAPSAAQAVSKTFFEMPAILTLVAPSSSRRPRRKWWPCPLAL